MRRGGTRRSIGFLVVPSDHFEAVAVECIDGHRECTCVDIHILIVEPHLPRFCIGIIVRKATVADLRGHFQHDPPLYGFSVLRNAILSVYRKEQKQANNKFNH